MPRINPVQIESTSPKTAEILATVKRKLGSVPNLLSTMAHSTATISAYLGFSQALTGGQLKSQLREQIALTVGQANECDYCLAAHSLLGLKSGLTDAEVIHARLGKSEEHQANAALVFARRIVDQHGKVTDADVDLVRAAGFSDGEVTEIVANVALNLFTNYFNHVAGTAIDFPAAPDLQTVALSEVESVDHRQCACA